MLRRILRISSFFAVILLVYLAREVNQAIPQPVLENQDIYYSYLEGRRLREGKNPYARVLEGDMLENQKYATYFPVFYELSYVSQNLGLRSYFNWIAFWAKVFVIFEFGVGFLLYIALARRNLEWLGVFAAAFWLFNRWTLKVVEMSNLDFIPIFLMLLSLMLFPRKKWLSLFLLSLSLGFKQIAIFLAPLYLLWIWRSTAGKDRWKELTLAGLMIVSVPLISGLPFLLWNAEGFIKSILFSATRYSSNQFDIPSLDQIMGWEGLSARLVMLVLMLAVYFAVLRGYGKKYFAALLIMSIFLDYNAVLYSQYPAWVVPLAPMVFLDLNHQIASESALTNNVENS
jgi:Gpi18-like mannosyltransferase